MTDLAELQTWVVVVGGILAAWDLLRSRSMKRLELLASMLSGPLKDFEGLADVNRALFLRYYRTAFFLDTRWFPLIGGFLFACIGGLSLGLTALVWRSLTPAVLVVMVVVSLLYLGLAILQWLAIKPMGKQTRIMIQDRLEKLEKHLLAGERETANTAAEGADSPPEAPGTKGPSP